MKVYFTKPDHPTADAEPWRNIYFDRISESAKKYDGDVFRSCDNPESSDLIVFVGDMGPHLEFVRKSKLYKKYRNKCFVFSPEGKAIKFARGMYASIDSNEYNEKLYRGGFYLTPEHIEVNEDVANPKYLYSFVGSIDTSVTRSSMLKLHRKNSLIVDVSNKVSAAWANYNDESEKEKLIKSYISSIMNSKFVLCPRGYNCSSIRLFECMKLGRVPVIISDAWTAPIGPKWKECSIRVLEKDILNIPTLLKERENEWKELGERAKSTWEKWFSEKNAPATIVKSCSEIAEFPVPRKYIHNIRCYWRMLLNKGIKYYIRTRINLYKEFRKIYF